MPQRTALFESSTISINCQQSWKEKVKFMTAVKMPEWPSFIQQKMCFSLLFYS